MIARGFKPVGWVAAVAGAALGCYMLSLNVAAERAELAKVERRIIAAKQEIRTLQTELGTRGRLQQLEHWNAEVLALSAPKSSQFLEDELMLARFDKREKTVEERATVQMASAEIKPAAPRAPKVVQANYVPAPQPRTAQSSSLVHRASYVVEDEKPVETKKVETKKVEIKKVAGEKPKAQTKAVEKPVAIAKADKPAPEPKKAKAATPAKKQRMIDETLVQDIRESAKAEKSGGNAAR